MGYHSEPYHGEHEEAKHLEQEFKGRQAARPSN